ncbi:MAG: diacylglycerol kinase [Gammaproteobacteria bacterium]|nr:diacylglycerol kinase [Gammaproteobacteria bacterium]
MTYKPGGDKESALMHVIRAAGYSMQGLAAAFRHELAFRIELFLVLFLLPAAIWLAQEPWEYILLIGSLVLVLIVELLNSAIEAVVDRFGGEHHELSGRAKDIASAAVFLSQMNVLIIWGMIVYFQYFR